MRKSRRNTLIGGIVALGLVLAGTGYAYWTDSLNVTTKATTGDFGVRFVDLGLYGQYSDETMKGAGWSIVDGIDESGFVGDQFFLRGPKDYNSIAAPGTIDAYKERAKGYNSVEFNAELVDKEGLSKKVGPYNKAVTDASGKIQITVDNMYPGYAQVFRSDIVNVGDIAAKLSNIKFEAKTLDKKDMGNLEDMIGVAVYIHREQYNPKNTGNEDTFKLAKAVASEVPSDDRFFTVGGVDFVRLSALDDVDLKKALQNNIIKCSPATDQRLDIFVGVAMDPDAKGVYTTGTTENRTDKDDKLSQGKGVQLSMDLLWDQFNAGKDAGTTNILVNQNKAAK
ncbi:MAG: signal peptide protein [Lachnoanaerobaculum sp.]|uniref:signal peptide protein n=1 Tax=Lachnoanaerobaculum sp. TaxID=2049030 RepID=UPI0025C507A0|nr:signal peptide protein [Lachnoanaerobaculum sp.]MBS5880886.1 signal peptide protein [Lachnoanaerobaculum sp.]